MSLHKVALGPSLIVATCVIVLGTFSFASAGPAPSPTPTSTPPPHVSDPDAAKATDKCGTGVAKAGAAFVKKWLKSLEKCGDAVFTCNQAKPAGEKRDACLEKARDKCEGALAKADVEGAKLEDAFAKKCGTLADGNVTGPEGLGFDAIAEYCDLFHSITVDDAASAAACVRRQHQCEAETLFLIQMPRVADVLGDAGINPPDCLFGAGSTGDVGDVVLGKLLEKCQKAIKKGGAVYAAKKLKNIQTCVDAVFECVQVKNGAALEACLEKAQEKCDKAFDKIDGLALAVVSGIDKKCGEIDESVLFDDNGLDLGGGVADKQCMPVDLDVPETLGQYEDCLLRQHDCQVADLVRFQNPRAAELLGLVGRELRAAFCPMPL